MENTFAAKVRRREPLAGGLLRMPNEQLVELAGYSGMDFVVIDCEHGGADQIALHHHIAAAALAGSAVIVRVGSDSEILRALDLGAAGILVPHVSDSARAREIVSRVKYPPEGKRGFAPYTRAARYGMTKRSEFFKGSSAEVALFLMVEDQRGLDEAETLAQIPGVDGLMFGPADFTVESGLDPGTQHPQVKEATLRIRAVAEATGAACIEIVGSASSAQEARAGGAHMLVYNLQESITSMMQDLVDAAVHRPSFPPLQRDALKETAMS